MHAACTASLRHLHSAHNQLHPQRRKHPTSAAARLKRALSQLTAPAPRTTTPAPAPTPIRKRAQPAHSYLQQEPHSYPDLGNNNV